MESQSPSDSLRACIGQLVVDEIRLVVRDSAQRALLHNEEIDDLRCKLKEYEEKIECLEQIVLELQMMLRGHLDNGATASLITTDSPTSPEHCIEITPPTTIQQEQCDERTASSLRSESKLQLRSVLIGSRLHHVAMPSTSDAQDGHLDDIFG
jgi:hypothetical protein